MKCFNQMPPVPQSPFASQKQRTEQFTCCHSTMWYKEGHPVLEGKLLFSTLYFTYLFLAHQKCSVSRLWANEVIDCDQSPRVWLQNLSWVHKTLFLFLLCFSISLGRYVSNFILCQNHLKWELESCKEC